MFSTFFPRCSLLLGSNERVFPSSPFFFSSSFFGERPLVGCMAFNDLSWHSKPNKELHSDALSRRVVACMLACTIEERSKVGRRRLLRTKSEKLRRLLYSTTVRVDGGARKWSEARRIGGGGVMGAPVRLTATAGKPHDDGAPPLCRVCCG